LRAPLLGAALLPVGLATHEVMHLAVFAVLGRRAELVTVPWQLRLVDLRAFSLHAAVPGTVPVSLQAVDNALGPLLAAALLTLLRSQVTDAVPRSALLANVCVQLFFAVLETAYPLLEGVVHVDGDVLLAPELTYGSVLAILLAVTFLSIPGRRGGGAMQPAG
jgi:hypothetical protein